MHYSRKSSLVTGVLCLPLLVACGDNSPQPMAGSADNTSAASSANQAISAEALITNATTVVENRVIATEEVALEDVVPAGILETGEYAGSAAQLASATLVPTEGNNVQGVVAFIRETETVDDELGEQEEITQVRIMAEINGLTPGPHGFHIHETGDCSAPDAASAGGHLNPQGVAHAGSGAEERHAGDLGNITASAYGVSTLDITDAYLAFDGANSVIGKAVVIHAGQDDLSSQPAGDAGARIACGEIEAEVLGS